MERFTVLRPQVCTVPDYRVADLNKRFAAAQQRVRDIQAAARDRRMGQFHVWPIARALTLVRK